MRVFLSVGTHPQQFNRLLREMDKLVQSGKVRAHVFAQTGNSTYEPKRFAFEQFISGSRYAREFEKASVVISHGGAGTIINALRCKKPLVIVPRLQRFGEHTNDHQLDLALALDARGKAIAVEKIGELGKALKRAAYFRPRIASERAGLIKEIGSFLDRAEAGKK